MSIFPPQCVKHVFIGSVVPGGEIIQVKARLQEGVRVDAIFPSGFQYILQDPVGLFLAVRRIHDLIAIRQGVCLPGVDPLEEDITLFIQVQILPVYPPLQEEQPPVLPIHNKFHILGSGHGIGRSVSGQIPIPELDLADFPSLGIVLDHRIQDPVIIRPQAKKIPVLLLPCFVFQGQLQRAFFKKLAGTSPPMPLHMAGLYLIGIIIGPLAKEQIAAHQYLLLFLLFFPGVFRLLFQVQHRKRGHHHVDLAIPAAVRHNQLQRSAGLQGLRDILERGIFQKTQLQSTLTQRQFPTEPRKTAAVFLRLGHKNRRQPPTAADPFPVYENFGYVHIRVLCQRSQNLIRNHPYSHTGPGLSVFHIAKKHRKGKQGHSKEDQFLFDRTHSAHAYSSIPRCFL